MNQAPLPETCRPGEAELFVNPNAKRFGSWSPRQNAVLSQEGFRQAEAVIHHWPGYQPTPLLSLDGLASSIGVGRIWYKNEAERFGLKSFKALGGAYAIAELIMREAAENAFAKPVSSPLLFAGRYRELASEITVASATDGNHGRSVAWGAKLFGCKAVIYIHATVSEGRKQAIEAYGAEVRRVDSNYDDSVRQCAADAAEHGWAVISDTSYPGYTEIPIDVMQGYGVMVAEAIAQLPPEEEPSHVFVQGGVGGMAAAAAAHLAWRWGKKRPMLVVVEPENAACLMASAKAGAPATIGGDLDTVMAGLSCGEPSLLAWEVLEEAADALMTLPDHAALATMRLLAEGRGGDRPLVAGESGVAGLAGAIGTSQVEELRVKLALDRMSRVLVFGTEGATDPELYEKIVGKSAEAIEAEAAT
ncbi:MAG: diaminopropionate ammonia-lyase [Alphaproteobacteria bacterium]|nr:diaminopropionate ammonia-lyase [Alphaproteobacteria bacterium]